MFIKPCYAITYNESIDVDMYLLIYLYCAQCTNMYVGTNMATKIRISPGKMHVTNIYVNNLHVLIGIHALKTNIYQIH